MARPFSIPHWKHKAIIRLRANGYTLKRIQGVYDLPLSTISNYARRPVEATMKSKAKATKPAKPAKRDKLAKLAKPAATP